MSPFKLVAIALAFGTLPHALDAAGKPENVPLAEIVRKLELGGYDPVVEVACEAKLWEIKAFKAGTALEVWVDRRTGRILSEHRDDPGLQLPQGSNPSQRFCSSLRRQVTATSTK